LIPQEDTGALMPTGPKEKVSKFAQNPEGNVQERDVFIRTLLENAPYPLLVINPDTSINYVNSALEDFTGFSSRELLSCKAPYPWWVGDLEAQIEDLKSALLRGEQKRERFGRKKKGDLFWIQVSDQPVTINGELKYFLSNWVDITERKKSEEQLSHLNQELRNLTAHLDSVREEERGNISRMIHDELGQALTALKMDVCWLRKSLTENQQPLLELSDSMVALIDVTFQKVRWLSTVLRPTWLDDLGLSDSMKWLAEEFQEMTEIKCKIAVERKLDLDKQLSTTIYRIFQEALTNIFRHSKASQVHIKLKIENNHIVLKVTDNGVGISKKQITSPRSFGIMGMRERAQFLGGAFDVKGVKNRGTFITVTLPVSSQIIEKQTTVSLHQANY
jgi:PAS domain S-box-containing protein